MQEIFNFIRENWQVIVSVITLIVSVVIAIVRKKPVTDIYSHILAWTIQAVKIAENTGLKGDEKLDYALGFIVEAFHSYYGKDTKLPCSLAYIENLVEQVLDTPQKKGGK